MDAGLPQAPSQGDGTETPPRHSAEERNTSFSLLPEQDRTSSAPAFLRGAQSDFSSVSPAWGLCLLCVGPSSPALAHTPSRRPHPSALQYRARLQNTGCDAMIRSTSRAISHRMGWPSGLCLAGLSLLSWRGLPSLLLFTPGPLTWKSPYKQELGSVPQQHLRSVPPLPSAHHTWRVLGQAKHSSAKAPSAEAHLCLDVPLEGHPLGTDPLRGLLPACL